MDDVYLYYVPLPPGINEMVIPCADGYTGYIDESLDYPHRLEAYKHILKHIEDNAFEKFDVNDIESFAHRKDNTI